MRRLIVCLAVLAAGLAPAPVTPSAQALDPVVTRIKIPGPKDMTDCWKCAVTFQGRVQWQRPDGTWSNNFVAPGPMTVHKWLPATQQWSLVYTQSEPETQFYMTMPGQLTTRTKYKLSFPSDSNHQGSSVVRTVTPTRDLGDNRTIINGQWIFRGNVDPGWGNKPVYIIKAACIDCPYRAYKKVFTDREGRWRAVLQNPPLGTYYYWRVYVPAAGGFAKSWGYYRYTFTSHI